MSPEIRARLQALGMDLSPPMMQGTTALMASIASPSDPGVTVTRDLQYGPDERNRLDLFRSGTPSGAPVLVYIHGGGFVMGNKSSPGLPFFENVGQWAAQQGWVGVTMTYRLAPAHRWPSGAEDVASAVRWLQQHIGGYGGDPRSIFVMGQSAGAAHLASYLAHPRFHAGGPGVAGALLISGIYDATTQPPSQFSDAYYGEGEAARSPARHIEGLIASDVPMLFSVSEFDPRDFQDQAAQLVAAWHLRKARYPQMEYLAGHNHLSPAQSIGSAEDQFARRIAGFVAVNRA